MPSLAAAAVARSSAHCLAAAHAPCRSAPLQAVAHVRQPPPARAPHLRPAGAVGQVRRALDGLFLRQDLPPLRVG